MRLVAALICLTLSGATHAALLGRFLDPLHGNVYRAVYDTDLNITWLLDGFPSMDWNGAQSLLSFVNEQHLYGVSDWRLPVTVQPDPTCDTQIEYLSGFVGGYGFNCTGSEFGHLYYEELGGIAGVPSQPFPFFNFVTGTYWSQPQGGGPTRRFLFIFNSGAQLPYNGSNFTDYKVFLVAPGDPLAVPVPAAAFLFPSALGLLGLRRRKA